QSPRKASNLHAKRPISTQSVQSPRKASNLHAKRPISTPQLLALTAAGFVAFVPQHLAMLASVNNDGLAELILGLTLLALLRSLRRPEGDRRTAGATRIGLLLGLAFLTKATIYFLPALAGLALLWRWRAEHRNLRCAIGEAVRTFLPALLLGGLWWGRDLAVYGWPDFLGLARHNAIVVGQPRTAEWIAQYGGVEVARRFFVTTFDSWWGQFGWMGVLMDRRVYAALLLFSLTITGGFGAALTARLRARSLDERERRAAGLLTLTALFSLTLYLTYNLTFVQFQGRYLFTALIPVGIAAAVGLSTLARPFSRLAGRSLAWLPLGAVGLLAALDIYALFRFIVPGLTR
ncbi:MAG: DUF2142 domain-containing protein, partial [Chloroflexi bacterium]|nr:DUF2142 domain-containing protein [Chloroflexota bacterium]